MKITHYELFIYIIYIQIHIIMFVKTQKKINDDIVSIGIAKDNLTGDYKDYLVMVEVNWDDRVGPKLMSYYPKNIKLEFSLDNVSFQLYEAIIAEKSLSLIGLVI